MLFLPPTNAPATDPYTLETVAGWTFHVETALEEKSPALWREVRAEATRQLEEIVRRMPDVPLAKLQKVPIWVHRTSPETACMAYHPGAEWLSEHKMNPEMERGVEIGNAENFLSWTYEQPWMILHELAHAYHFRELPDSFDNLAVKSAYDAAMRAKRYESVRHWNGGMAKHYATTNPMEYFAETTEAYFGTNDFFPFVRAELMNADPDGYALMKEIWGEPIKRKA